MPLIEVNHLTKIFKTFERKEGVWGGIENLFVRQYRDLKAVDEFPSASIVERWWVILALTEQGSRLPSKC